MEIKSNELCFNIPAQEILGSSLKNCENYKVEKIGELERFKLIAEHLYLQLSKFHPSGFKLLSFDLWQENKTAKDMAECIDTFNKMYPEKL